MFKVIVFDAELCVWCMIGSYRTEADGRVGAAKARDSREWQYVTLALVRFVDGVRQIDIITSNAPRSELLPTLSNFCAAADRR